MASTPMDAKLFARASTSGQKMLLVAMAWLAAFGFFLAMVVLAAVHAFFVGDIGLAQRLQSQDAAPYRTALAWAEALSDIPLLGVVWLVALVLLWLSKRRLEVGLLILTMVGRLPNSLVKELVGRPRPSPELVTVTGETSGFGFPSGHVEGAVLLYGFLFYLAGATISHRPLRWLAQAVCVVIVCLAAIQRIYVGAHWPSDVLGGLLLGGLLLAPLLWLHRRYAAGSV